MKASRLILRMLRRDWHAGEMRILILAIVIAVASLTSVNLFTDRIEQALERQANALLGADLLVSSDQPISQHYSDEAQRQGLHSSRAQEFPSMVMADDNSALVAIKAVTNGYPLRGQLRLADQQFGPERLATGIPASGTVWVERRLLNELQADIGSTLMVGFSPLRVTAVITHEPARASGNLFSLAPRLLLNMQDLAATQLVQPASRIKYQLYLAGSSQQIDQYRPLLQQQLTPGEQLLGIENARPEVRNAMRQARRFLGLAALVSVLLAGVAVAMATQRFVRNHLDNCAVMRCLGASQALILQIYIGQIVLLGLAASTIGLLLGYLAQAGLVGLLAPLLGTPLPAPSLAPAGWGLLTGLVTLIGFSAPPLLQLKNVPALRLLRREMGRPQSSALLVYSAGFITLALLIILQVGDLKLASIALAGVTLSLLLLALLAWLLVLALKRIRSRVGVGWRFGLANISRRGGASIIQVVGFGLGIMALLLLTLVRTELLEQWQGSLPDDAANRFLINIQPQQIDAVQQFLTANGLPKSHLFPMVRGRLSHINGQPVSADEYSDERAKRLINREFNLSWADELQDDNEIIAGRWWNKSDHGKAYISVEVGIANSLDLKLGDRLTYRVGSREFSANITSLRRVEWESFRANFFVLATPGLLKSFPATYITSLYLSKAEQPLLNGLVAKFPNITVIDVDQLMKQIRNIIERVTLAVEYVFIFTLLAGLVVMIAAINATMDERIKENAILRTLGARRGQLQQGIMAEFAGLGLLAGVVAATAASLTSYLLATQLFNLPYTLNIYIWLLGALIGGVGIGLAGTFSARATLRQSPLLSLRG
ncbi:MAG: ABC transporter permease [Candidatus Polarisedimenticolaceae bacterium]|nr:ABC transporter permease [Candidatus Polarisedimenticolaceae bacterium]